MNIFERIEKDHEVQRSLMTRILATEGDTVQRRELFAEFYKEFDAHASAEEHAFYAPMMKEGDTTEQSRHSVAEHQEAMELLGKIKETDMSSSAWLTHFKKFADENEHHMEEEEKEVFSLVKKTFGEDILKQMLSQFNNRKEAEVEGES